MVTMTASEHLRIVFRVAGVGFVMPVADLLAICESSEGFQPRHQVDPDGECLGEFAFRGETISVHDLARLFNLPDTPREQDASLLVFAGSDVPWAIMVDRVEGVFGIEQLQYRELAPYLFDRTDVPYRHVALMNGEPLLGCDSGQLDLAWGAR